MNISNREKQTLRRNNPTIGLNSIATHNKNSFVTPLLYSLKNLPKLRVRKVRVNKNNLIIKKRLLLNLLRNKNRIIISKNTIINPAYTKITNYLSDLINKSTMVNAVSTNNKIIAFKNNTTSFGSYDAQLADNHLINTSAVCCTSQLNNPTEEIALPLARHTQYLQTPVSPLAPSHMPDVGLDTKFINSLSEEDSFTKGLKELAISFNQTNKLNELRKKSFSKQFNLRKYLKSLYTFNSNIAFNKNVVYKFNKNTATVAGPSIPQAPSVSISNVLNSYKSLSDFKNIAALEIGYALTHTSGCASNGISNKNVLELKGASVQEQSGIVQGRSQSGEILKNLYHILKNSFLTCYCIISKPILEFTPNKVVIKLFYYDFSKLPMPKSSLSFLSRGKLQNTAAATPNQSEYALPVVLGHKSIKGLDQVTKEFNFTDKNIRMSILKELEYLCINLSKLMKTSVVFDLVELKSYQLEGNILANSIAILTDKLGRNFRKTVNKIFKKTIIINPLNNKNNNDYAITGNKAIAFYTGINIRLAGRLSRQSIIPRKTVKIIQRGSLARRYSDFLTISKYTAKNRRGIFCYTITIGHKYY